MSETLALSATPVPFSLRQDRILPPLCILPPIRSQTSYSPFERSPPLVPLEPSTAWPILPGPGSYFSSPPRSPPSSGPYHSSRIFARPSLSPRGFHDSASSSSRSSASPIERFVSSADSRAPLSTRHVGLLSTSPLSRPYSDRAPVILSMPPTPAVVAEQRIARGTDLHHLQARCAEASTAPVIGLGIRHAPTAATAPTATTATASATVQPPRAVLRMRQQPLAARACGFGERDRRVIDPPPIVQLEMLNAATGQPDLGEAGHSMNVVHASLWNARGTCDVTNLVMPGQKSTRRLMGTLVASATVAVDEHNEQGAFFAFPDLSCRSQGDYRLRFTFMRVSDGSSSAAAPVVAHVMSDVFTVYSAKDFPGMRPSTALTLALKRQGVAIQAKKGRYGVSSPSTSSSSAKRSRESSDNEDDADSTIQGSEKRRRRSSEDETDE